MPAKYSSSIKRDKQSKTRRSRNRIIKSKVRTVKKQILDELEGKNVEAAEKKLLEFTKLIDTAARKGLYHKNNAARNKSRLQIRLNKAKAAK